MINSIKRLAPMGKSMSYIVLIFAATLIVIPLYKSMEIDFEAVFGCLIRKNWIQASDCCEDIKSTDFSQCYSHFWRRKLPSP